MRAARDLELARLKWPHESKFQLRRLEAEYESRIKDRDEEIARLLSRHAEESLILLLQTQAEGEVERIQGSLEVAIDAWRQTNEEDIIQTQDIQIGSTEIGEGFLTNLQAKFGTLGEMLGTLEDTVARIKRANETRRSEQGIVATELTSLQTSSKEEPSREQDSDPRMARFRLTNQEDRPVPREPEKDSNVQLQALHQEIEHLRIKLRDVEKASVKELSRVYQLQLDLNYEKQSLEKALANAQDELLSTRGKLRSNEKELTKLQQVCNTMTDLGQTSVSSPVNTTDNSGEKETEITKLKEAAAKLKQNLEVAKKELDRYAVVGKEMRENNESLDSELGEKKAELEVHSVNNAEMGRTLAAKQTEIDRLTQELGTSNEREEVLLREAQYAEGEALDYQRHLRYQDDSLRDYNDQIGLLEGKLRTEEARRRDLFEQVQMLRGTIRAVCRIRPIGVDKDKLLEYKTETGKFHGHPATLIVNEDRIVGGQVKTEWSDAYDFERVFLPKETTQDVFEEINNFAQSFLDGKKVCIFCYGQSGTGKTYTMSHYCDAGHRVEGMHYQDDGIIPRLNTMLFEERARLEQHGSTMQIEGCCYEIYNNDLWLLKAEGSEKKTILANNGVKDPEFMSLDTMSNFDTLVKVGMKNRHFGKTDLNDKSSRSHFIITLKTTVTTDSETYGGLLHLVDLAGSERRNEANTAGAASREGTQINQSLSALGNVFRDLASDRKPFCRGNKLTELLEPSLQRDCMTLMMVMISPLKEHWSTTKNVLGFALMAQSAKKHDNKGKGTKSAAEKAPPVMTRRPAPRGGRGRGR
ncbi:P-loop containing nucleoside triphosphate hydrolase protein [Hypoxylon fuscum]|nr:P-loop containing nucleoside triphosphate hydrolase protein [Hypoxylon fuscum]